MFTGSACDRLRCNRPGDITHLRLTGRISPYTAMRTLLTTLLISLMLLTGIPGHAGQLAPAVIERVSLPSLETMQNGGLTLDQAVEQVRRKYNGRIVSAKTQVSGCRETHEIKVLTQDGKVKTERVPGKRRC